MNDIPVAVRAQHGRNAIVGTPTPGRRSARRSLVLVCMLAMGGAPVVGWAYVGPGAGLSIIGTLLALLAAVILGVVGFVWYPVRRLLRFMRARRSETQGPGEKPDADA